jgi:ankyrin repeat protein
MKHIILLLTLVITGQYIAMELATIPHTNFFSLLPAETQSDLYGRYFSLQSFYNFRCTNKQYNKLTFYQHKSIPIKDAPFFQRIFLYAIKNKDNSRITDLLQCSHESLRTLDQQYPFLYTSMLSQAVKQTHKNALKRLIKGGDKNKRKKDILSMGYEYENKEINILCSRVYNGIPADNNYETYMQRAIDNNHFHTLFLILQNDQPHNIILTGNEIPERAIDYDYVLAVLQQKNNLTITADQKKGFLKVALQNGHVEMLKELSHHGIGKNEIMLEIVKLDNNAIIDAITSGNLEYLKYLVELLQVDLNAFSPDAGRTLLFVALQGGYDNIAHYLLENMSIDNIEFKNPATGNTLLHEAILCKRPKIVSLILQLEARVNETNNNGETPFNLFIKKHIRHLDHNIGKILKHWGADINRADITNQTPTDYAFLEYLSSCEDQNRADILKTLHWLVKNGGTVSVPAHPTKTVDFLQDTIDRGASLKVIRLILPCIANINAKLYSKVDIHCRTDYIGNTPLHRAILTRNTELIEALLQHGADASISNYIFLTPVHYALWNKNFNVLRFIAQHNLTAFFKISIKTGILLSAFSLALYYAYTNSVRIYSAL